MNSGMLPGRPPWMKRDPSNCIASQIPVSLGLIAAHEDHLRCQQAHHVRLRGKRCLCQTIYSGTSCDYHMGNDGQGLAAIAARCF